MEVDDHGMEWESRGNEVSAMLGGEFRPREWLNSWIFGLGSLYRCLGWVWIGFGAFWFDVFASWFAAANPEANPPFSKGTFGEKWWMLNFVGRGVRRGEPWGQHYLASQAIVGRGVCWGEPWGQPGFPIFKLFSPWSNAPKLTKNDLQYKNKAWVVSRVLG